MGDSGYRVTRYDLDIDYRAPSNRLAGLARLSCVAERDLTRFTVDLVGLRVVDVRLSARGGGRFGTRGGRLLVRPRSPIRAGARFRVDIRYRGKPGRGLAAALYPRNERDGERSTYRIQATVDAGYVVLAGAEPGPGASPPAGRRGSSWLCRHEEPVALERAAIHIGRYELLRLRESDSHHLAVEPGSRAAALRVVPRQARMTAFFERLFGDYPLGSYLVVAAERALDAPVERHGMTILGMNHLTGWQAEGLLAFSLARQWFGSGMTAASRAETWFTGGLARYAAWLWSSESGSTGLAALAGRARRRAVAERESGTGDEGLFERGALAVYELHDLLGDGEFFALLRQWCDAHRHSPVSALEFREFVASRATGAPQWPLDGSDVTHRVL